MHNKAKRPRTDKIPLYRVQIKWYDSQKEENIPLKQIRKS